MRPLCFVPCVAVLLYGVTTWAQPQPGQPVPEPLPPGEEPTDIAPPPPPPAPPAATPTQPGYGPGYPPSGYGQGYPPPPGYGQGYPPHYATPAPPPPPPPDRTVYRHDGFYLRFGIGPAYGSAKSEAEGIQATFEGAGPAYELLIGGTLGSGFVLGGGFVGQDIQDPEVTVDLAGAGSASGVASNETLGVVALGLFGDWFPDPEGGAHVGALIGIGALGLQGDNDEASTGAGASLWAGYDFWVGKQWSLGPEVRLVAVSTERQVLGTTFQDSATSFEVLFSALYH